jgi:hypothetical protein
LDGSRRRAQVLSEEEQVLAVKKVQVVGAGQIGSRTSLMSLQG